MKRFILTIIVAVAAVTMLHAQQKSVGVKKYGAEPLRFSSVEEWESVHRPIISEFFQREVYGYMPTTPGGP